MIEPMKKYSFLVYHGVYMDFLHKLRDAGVLHILEKQQVNLAENADLRDCMEQSKRLNAMMRQLTMLGVKGDLQEADTTKDGMALLSRLEKTFIERTELQIQIQSLQKEIDAAAIWGDFDWQSIERLKAAGCQISFYTCQKAAYQSEWETSYHAIVIRENGSNIYFITLCTDGVVPDIAADKVRMSASSLSELNASMIVLQEKATAVKLTLEKAALEDMNTLKHTECLVRDRYNFSKAIIDTEKTAGEKVMLLEGYVPEDKEADLLAMLQEENVYYQSEKVALEKDVPIRLKNNWFSRLYEPITKMYSLPNYTELDPTPFLAPFFMLFFGLCMGDGGYGLLIFIVCTIAKKKMGGSARLYCSLGQTLGISTLVVGILTGSFFGIALDAVEWNWLKGVKSYFLTQANYGDRIGGYNPMMFIAIIIGVIQILYGMFIQVAKITKQVGFKYALSKLGWAVGIILLLVTFGLPALGVTLSTVVTYILYGLIAVCVLFIVFYNSPDKNIFINIGSSLWDTYNMASGLLGDVLSYIRLFALGLTGAILGSVFNTMAFGMTEGLPVYARWLVVLAILLVGHGINFALCMIGALVHPMRLTFVEFYKNSGFEGGGAAYTPFKKVTEND